MKACIPRFSTHRMQRVLLKIPRLAARVLVTDIKHWYRNLYYGGDRVKSLVTTSSDWQPPGGIKDAKAKSEPKRSDPRQRAHHCTSVAKSSWWELSCYSRTKMLNLLILSTRVQTQTCGDVRMFPFSTWCLGNWRPATGTTNTRNQLSASLMSKEAISVKK